MQVSVVVRSFGRLPSLCQLLERLLAQDHPSFEIVVVEQTVAPAAAERARLEQLAIDPRLRVLDRPPLGGARARNVGASAARGTLVVFIDDDDLPRGTDFLTAIAAPFADPRCLAVTCRHVWRGSDLPSARYQRRAARRCMRFSHVLRLPHTFARHDASVRPVDYVHGTGGAIRRSALLRFGGWDEDTAIEDESSFGMRAARTRAPDEYFAFVPAPIVERDMHIPGGLDKRGQTQAVYFAKLMRFVHRIVGRYHPARVRLLYPLYVLACFGWTFDWIMNDARRYRSGWTRLGATFGLIARLPWLVVRQLATVPLGRLDEACASLPAPPA